MFEGRNNGPNLYRFDGRLGGPMFQASEERRLQIGREKHAILESLDCAWDGMKQEIEVSWKGL